MIATGLSCLAQGPSSNASTDFDRYVSAVQTRIEQEHSTAPSFLAGMDPDRAARLRRGGVIVDRLTPPAGESLPGALLHDWRGTVFVPGATTADFEGLLRDFGDYPTEFAPQVLEARALNGPGQHLRMTMRVRQQHLIAVTLDETCDVRFGRLDTKHGWSTSQSTGIEEIGANGRPVSIGAEHGFLWRLDTWWSYEQKDGGLYVQIETVSLTRSIPAGLGWVVGPLVENIPRDSLEFTLRAARAAVENPMKGSAGHVGKGEQQ